MLSAEQLEALVGLPVGEAEARVRAGGLVPRTLHPGAIVSAEHTPDRVNLIVDNGTVSQVYAG